MNSGFSPEVTDLLSQRVISVITTLLPDGSPHSVIAGVVIDGDQLVSHTGPAAWRLGNLRHDPRIDVLAVDPVNPMRYVEIRGTATLQEISDDQSKLGPLKEHAEKYALPKEAARIPAGVHVVQIRITPHKVNYFDRQRSQMGPATQQVRPGDPQRTGPSRESSCLTGEDVAGDTSLPSRRVER